MIVGTAKILRFSDAVRINYNGIIVAGIVVNDAFRYANLYLIDFYNGETLLRMWFRNGTAILNDMSTELRTIFLEENVANGKNIDNHYIATFIAGKNVVKDAAVAITKIGAEKIQKARELIPVALSGLKRKIATPEKQ